MPLQAGVTAFLDAAFVTATAPWGAIVRVIPNVQRERAVNSEAVPLESIGRVPIEGDNAAIAIRNLDAGLHFRHLGKVHTLSHSILEGHRFAVESIPAGAALLSWNQPFGRALREIRPGEYLCNAGTLDALRIRNLPFPLPEVANFQNASAKIDLDDGSVRYGGQVESHPSQGTFMGYAREGRAAGTRNYLVVLGTTSSTAAFARLLTERLQDEVRQLRVVDGIVAMVHTEGSGPAPENNREILLRTLAGFLVNPNVGAVLAVDLGNEQLTNAHVEQYARAHDYPLDRVPHRFYSLTNDIDADLRACHELMRELYPLASCACRSPQPLRDLRIGLQCGGSDAFSGISANPLVGWMGKELIRHGGSANLAETDELIGAEGYVLSNVRDRETARSFLDKLRVFAERISWHGHSAEGNPTGGNKFRGLYNISLKSIGAARKKDPDVRLDYVIDYAQRMDEPGFYFMDSPGNDLESISGQVGAGCNVILFTTGNGSITNNPLVPTIKLMTTSRRWQLLSQDMDINAGRYQDGESMSALGRESFEYMVEVASGRSSVGERAGHSQVSIWRNWQQRDASQLERLTHLEAPSGTPIALPKSIGYTRAVRESRAGVGLIVPTSLCAGQIALRIASTLNEQREPTDQVARYVALAHTEGCGASAGENEDHQLRTLIGYLRHPMVGPALLLEHGCERTHNDMLRHALKRSGLDAERYGYASIQLDGGIDKVVAKVCEWFRARHSVQPQPAALSIALVDHDTLDPNVARVFGHVALDVLGAGGSVVVPRTAHILRTPAFLELLGNPDVGRDTLSYGQTIERHGLHVMATPSRHDVETLTGLGATGASVILVCVKDGALQANPLVPTLQVASAIAGGHAASDIDLLIDPAADADKTSARLLELLRATARDDYQPLAGRRGFHNFQLTRGHLGVSL